MGDLVHHEMATHKNCELIVPAMVRGSGLEACFDDFPLRSLDVGIAEEHAITLSGAMSIAGLHPIVTIYSTFLQRAYDELLHDCARMNTDMTLLIDRAGLVGKNGATHQGIYDEAFLKSIPGVVLSMPSTFGNAHALLEESLEKGHGVFAIRYPHEMMSGQERNYQEQDISFGKWIVRNSIRNGGTNIVSVGPLGFRLYEKIKDLDVGFIDAIFLSPLDMDRLSQLLSSKHIVLYDPYGTKNGFVESVLSALMELGYQGKVSCFSLPSVFIEHASVDEQLSDYGLLVDQVLARILALLDENKA